MKNSATKLSIVLTLALAPLAMADDITQNTSLDLEKFAVRCSGAGATTVNHYYRRFDLDGEFGLMGDVDINGISYGISSTADPMGVVSKVPYFVRLYAIANNDDTLLANLQLLTEKPQSIADTDAIEKRSNISASIDANTFDLVANISYELTATEGHDWRLYRNNAGQSGDSFLRSSLCGFSELTSFADLGEPNHHLVMVVHHSEPDSSCYVIKANTGKSFTICL